MSVSNVAVLSILPLNDVDLSPVVSCGELVNFTFSAIGYISISNLIFSGCGGNKIESVGQLTIEHSMFLG